MGVAKELQRMQRLTQVSSANDRNQFFDDSTFSLQTDEDPPRHLLFAADQVVTIGGAARTEAHRPAQFINLAAC